jgi:glycine/serine hydroxymethyltransferase
MRQEQMITLGALIVEVLRSRDQEIALKELTGQISELASAFPAYPLSFPGFV